MHKCKLFSDSKLKLVIFFSLIILAIPKIVLAQSREFIPGYYLTPNKDTVKVEILFDYWIISPSEVTVKNLQSGEIKTFHSNEISGFGLKNKKFDVDYRSITVELKYIQFPDNVVIYGQNPFNETEEISFFAKNLISGEHASLYQMIDKYERERFFIEKEGNITELLSYEYTTQKESDQKILKLTNDSYKNQLRSICSDAPKMLNKTPGYSENHLKKYILEYNSCFLGDVIKVSKHEKTTFNFVAGIGLGHQRYYTPFPGEGPELNPNKFSPKAEAGLKVNFANTFKTVFFELDCNLFPDKEIKNDPLKRLSIYIGKTYRNTHKVQQRFFAGTTEAGGCLLIGNGLTFKKKLNLDLRTKIYSSAALRFDLIFQYTL